MNLWFHQKSNHPRLLCGFQTSLEAGGSDPWPGYKYSGPLRPVYPLSPRRAIPDHIQKPDYAETGIPLSEQNIRSSSTIEALPKQDIDALRKVCKVRGVANRCHYQNTTLQDQRNRSDTATGPSFLNRLPARSLTLELQQSRPALQQMRLTASFTMQPSSAVDTHRL